MDRQDLFARLLGDAGIEVAPEPRERLLWLLDELLRWNRRINLTAITDPLEAVEKHLVDSLTLLPLVGPSERVLDLGSGGGFPGLPLKVARPDIELYSVDAVGKKISFQRHVARHLGVSGFVALHARAEELPRRPECREGFDLILSRAFADLGLFAALARPLMRARGRIVAMKGPEGRREATDAEKDLARLGLRCLEVRPLRLPASGAERNLVVLGTEKEG